jgi:voltage-gated potassium channel
MSARRRYPLLERIFGTVPGVRWLVGGIVATTFACALVMRVLDSEEYPSFGLAFWWAIQTVTTIGYGDVTPSRWEGRVVASILMIAAVATISLLTASIAAAFVERRRRASQQGDPVQVALERIEQRLERLEQRVGK